MDYEAEIKKSQQHIAELKQQQALSRLQSRYVIVSNFKTEPTVTDVGPKAFHNTYQCYLNTPKLYQDQKGVYNKYLPQPLNVVNDPVNQLQPDDFLFTRSEAETFAKQAPVPKLIEAGIIRADQFPQHQYFMSMRS